MSMSQEDLYCLLKRLHAHRDVFDQSVMFFKFIDQIISYFSLATMHLHDIVFPKYKNN